MQEDRAAFIEGFALKLNESGMQRMAARVFAALLTAPGGGLTAREIAETLDVSAGAVSGATSYLTRTGLVERTRTPRERVDRYDIRGTSWAEAMAVETELLHSLSSWLDKGASAVAGDPEAVDRLEATRDFFAFMADEMPQLVERWQASRQQS
jgi:DNA-binding transcriptional regulator GbsR (MarR family)